MFFSESACRLTTVLTLGAVNESLGLASPVGLFTLQANATYCIGNDLRLQGQNNAIKNNHISCSHGNTAEHSYLWKTTICCLNSETCCLCFEWYKASSKYCLD